MQLKLAKYKMFSSLVAKTRKCNGILGSAVQSGDLKSSLALIEEVDGLAATGQI